MTRQQWHRIGWRADLAACLWLCLIGISTAGVFFIHPEFRPEPWMNRVVVTAVAFGLVVAGFSRVAFYLANRPS